MSNFKTMLAAGREQFLREIKLQFILLLVVTALGLLIVEPVQNAYDRLIRERPFVTATVKLVRSNFGPPRVLYSTKASVDVRVFWSAWVDVAGERTCGGGGTSGHGPRSTNVPPKLWTWEDWLGRDCAVPEEPFSVCVRYVTQTAGGVGDTTPAFCSPPYIPRGYNK